MNKKQIIDQLWYRRAEFRDEMYHDGDTIWVRIDNGRGNFQWSDVRISGVDTPELRGGDADSKRRAQDAKNFVRMILKLHQEQDGWIYLKSYKSSNHDKYGRLLYDVFLFRDEDGIEYPEARTLAEVLIERGLGEEYDK